MAPQSALVKKLRQLELAALKKLKQLVHTSHIINEDWFMGSIDIEYPGANIETQEIRYNQNPQTPQTNSPKNYVESL